MKKIKNILITTLSETKDIFGVSYYCFKDENGSVKFCTGISNAEAGTKYMLSNYKIDQIYVLGPKDKNCTGQSIEIKNAEMPTVIDATSVNELEFFCYRMSQFLNHIDIEANDIIFECDKSRRDELEKLTDEIVPKNWEGAFCTLANDDELYTKFKETIGDKVNSAEMKVLMHSLYSKMDTSLKMNVLDSNDTITVQYVGVDMLENGEISADSLFHSIGSLFSGKDSHYNLYMDLQGMDKGDSVSIWNIMTIYQNINNSLSVESIICTQNEPNSFTNCIYDENERYSIELLLSGIRSFLYYGKTEQFEDYFKKSSIANRKLKNMLIAMQYVGIGVSLNNTNDLTYGIELIRSIVNTEASDNMDPHEKFVYNLICTLIKEDYGKMLTSESLELIDLITWAKKKGFYQQALTMVESLVPADLIKKGIFYYARNKDDLEKLKRILNIEYWSDGPKNRYVYNDIDHYYLKSFARSLTGIVPKDKRLSEYAKLRIKQLHEPLGDYPMAYSNLGNEDMLYEL